LIANGIPFCVHMYHTKDWSQQSFKIQAYKMEGMSVPEYCEAEILYTVPIHIQDSDFTT
jgi:hypothetical protein